ncbi:MAG: extracellular solute-binding protein [Oscillospiraceae bacterium]|nr:extracellular solute-binding protein [Oscillospiraceae bacterium]
MFKRIAAIICTITMIIALVGCGSTGREIVYLTLSTEDSAAILAAAGITLPDVEEAEGANSVVEWFCWYDPFNNYSEDEIVNTGYYTFTEKYGCSITWTETTYSARYDDLANLILSSQSPDCYPAGSYATAVFPMKCIKGTFVPVDDYVDYTDPLWSGVSDTADYFVLGGEHYAIVTDLTYRNVVSYNRRVIEEYGYDDPAELYYNDEWTWDVFYEMCVDFSDPDEDRYALDGYAYQRGIIESTGQEILQIENGVFYSNIDSPEIERAQSLWYDLVKNDCCYNENGNYWALRTKGGATFGAGIADGLCLFYIIETSYFTMTVDEITPLWGDVTEGEVMFCPLPRDDDGDGTYYLNSAPEGYMLVTGGDNHAGAALLAACERFKIIDPTVINIDQKQLKEIYLWTDEMLEMDSICYEIASANQIMVLTGDLSDGLENAISGIMGERNDSPSTWAQLKESYRDMVDYYIEELNAQIDSYNS